MVSRQQNYQLMLYYSEYYDDIYVYTGDAVQFRKELRQNTIGSDIIIEKIVTRLYELMFPEKKTKNPQVKKKASGICGAKVRFLTFSAQASNV